MLGLIVTFRISAASVEAFERDFSAMVEGFRRDEPDTIAYHVLRQSDEIGAYRTVEIYRSEAALQFHQASPAFQDFRAKLGGWLVEPPRMERFAVLI